jgi:citrate lyase beta subunit
MMRSKLFAPAIRFDLYEKALLAGADAVCFDLEDAVAADRKGEARGYLQPFLVDRSGASPKLLVRTNPVSSADFAMDLDASVWPSVFALTLPKVESPNDIHLAERAIAALESSRSITTPLRILPTIESPRGLRMAAEIAKASQRIFGLQIGFADLLEPIGITPDNVFARNQVRLLLRFAAAEADLDCYDSAFPDFNDLAAYQRHLDAALSFGFAGCSCIHPAQIEPTNRTFTPSAEALAQARKVIEAAQEAARRGVAVVSLDGKMIDHPFILAAQRLLSRDRP